MSYDDLLLDGSLRVHPLAREHEGRAQEIAQLRLIARRALGDAAVEAVSIDGRFESAYTAAHSVATMVATAEGYRVAGAGHHRVLWDFLGRVASGRWGDAASYLQRCRRKRNVIMYHQADAVTREELDGLIAYAKALGEQVEEWLANEHPLLG